MRNLHADRARRRILAVLRLACRSHKTCAMAPVKVLKPRVGYTNLCQ
jgi:hypothetical protein